MRDEVRGLSGGRKVFWMRVHRQEIIDFYNQHGAFLTMQEFNLRFDTMENFLRDAVKVDKQQKSPGQDRDKLTARMEINEATIRALASQMRRLEKGYGEFVPQVADQIARKYILPGIINGLSQMAIEASPALPESDPLTLENEADSRKLYVMETPDTTGEDLT